MARRRPSSPAAVAARKVAERKRARDPATWGVDGEAMALVVNADVEARSDLAGRTVRARRLDAFDVLGARGALSAGALNAARRLQNDVAILHRAAGGVAAYAPRIDRSPESDAVSLARHRAGLRIEAALARAGPVSARLITALIEPAAALGRIPDWREVVRRETGERLPDAQSAALRAACENLAAAYAALDKALLRQG